MFRPTLREWTAGAIVVVAGACALSAAYLFGDPGLAVFGKVVAPLVTMAVLGVLGGRSAAEVAGRLVERWRARYDLREPSLAKAADRLAEVVRLRWEHRTTVALSPTRARLVERHSGAAAVLRLPEQVPIIAAMVGRGGQLVVCGRDGVGKSTLACLVIGEMTARRRPGEVVAVPLQVADWPVAEIRLTHWIARHLADEYDIEVPVRRRFAFLHALLDHGWVVPVLDGLDELPEGRRGAAVDAIAAALAGGTRMVVTSPPEVVDRLLAAAALAVLAELAPIPPADAMKLLTETAPRAAALIRHDPGGPLAAALSTPLMLALARRVFADAEQPPPPALTGRAHAERFLVARFIESAWRGDRRGPGGRRPIASQRWLAYLAGMLARQGTSRLAWWHLHLGLPRWKIRCALAVIFGLVVAALALPAAALAAWAYGQHVVGFAIVGGLLGALFGGSISAFSWPPAHPSPYGDRHLPLRLIRPRAKSHIGLLISCSLGLGAFAGAGAALAAQQRTNVSLATALPWSVAATAAAIFIVGLQWVCTTSAIGVSLPTPWSTYRSERRVTLVFLVAYGAGASLLAVILTDLVVGPMWGFVTGIVAPTIGLMMHRGGNGVSMWLLFAGQRTALAARGRLPWRLMDFLDRARRVGLLHQVGAVYEFYHPAVLRHLRRYPGHGGLAPRSSPVSGAADDEIWDELAAIHEHLGRGRLPRALRRRRDALMRQVLHPRNEIDGASGLPWSFVTANRIRQDPANGPVPQYLDSARAHALLTAPTHQRARAHLLLALTDIPAPDPDPRQRELTGLVALLADGAADDGSRDDLVILVRQVWCDPRTQRLLLERTSDGWPHTDQ